MHTIRRVIICLVVLAALAVYAKVSHARGMSGGGHASSGRGSHAIWNARTGR